MLRALFGPSKTEIWRQLAEQVGGEFEARTWTRPARVTVRHGAWTLTLDTHTVSNGESSHVYTRMRAPYVNPEGFRFEIYRANFLSDLARMFGLQDIDIGDLAFDPAFIIKSNDEARVRRLLEPRRIRDLIAAQPRIHLSVRDDEGWFGTEFPEGVDELYFRAYGVIRDLPRLEQLFELFAIVLQRLCAIGAAYEAEPDVKL
jgi:hypothetical protein